MTCATEPNLVGQGGSGGLYFRYLLGCLILLLAGCGQTGPLYLPESENNVEIAKAAPVAD